MTDKKELWRQLAYLAENFDFDDPEDAWAKREYKQIKKQLDIPSYKKKKKS
jgi:hypothetical protein